MNTNTVPTSLFASGDPIDDLYRWEDEGGAIPQDEGNDADGHVVHTLRRLAAFTDPKETP